MDINTFTERDYNSDYGFLTSIWGPPMWTTLHIISFTYPENPSKEDKQNYYDFFNNLKNILPCQMCRKNLIKNLKNHKLTKDVFKNRYTLSLWVYQLHEIVNKMLGKESKISYEEVRCLYENFRAHCIEDKTEKNEQGCKEPLYGVYSKIQLYITPQNNQTIQDSMIVDPSCFLKKNPI
jgi:hypothetical protein